MEPRRNIRVVPSNGPVLTNTPQSIIEDSQPSRSLQPCPNFNHGIGCRSCAYLHACSACASISHGLHECKKKVLQVSSGNVGQGGPYYHVAGLQGTLESSHAFTPHAAFPLGSDHSAQAALKLQQRKSRREAERGSTSRPSNRPELKSARYNQYREKYRSKGSKCTVWPDDIEEAFQAGQSTFRHHLLTKLY